MSEPIGPTSSPPDGTAQVGLAGVMAGLALPVLYVAWLNRGGPGEVCRVRGDGQACVDAWSPWPFLGAALVCLAAACLLLRLGLGARRGARASGTHPGSLWLGAGWAVVGVLSCVSVLGVLTIGLFVLPIALLLVAILLRRVVRRRAAGGS